MLRALREEMRTPNWDQDLAAQLLELMGNGATFTKACEIVGISRAVAMSWRRMVPEFAKWVTDLETDLGAYHRDMAADEGDAALMRAKLALAGSFDRRIAKGDADVQVAQGINVTVNW